MEHEMILLSADLRTVYARLAVKFNATVAESLGAPPVREKTEVGVLSVAPQSAVSTSNE
jgi:uncharacterized protein YlxP (DUF503 family)